MTCRLIGGICTLAQKMTSKRYYALWLGLELASLWCGPFCSVSVISLQHRTALFAVFHQAEPPRRVDCLVPQAAKTLTQQA